MYAASRWLRMGYRIPLISTLTTLESMADAPDGPGLQVQRLDLLEHVADARADLLALRAERGELGAGAFGFRRLRAGGLQLRPQPRVLFGGTRLLRAGAPELVAGARLFRPRPVQHGHELL